MSDRFGADSRRIGSELVGAEIMPFRQAQSVLELYQSAPLRDRMTILARLIFCTRAIVTVLEQHLPKRGTMLDLGCGYGITSHLVSVSHPDRMVIGFDISSRRIAVARRSVDHRENVEFRAEDIREFQASHCDAVMLIDILSRLPYPDQEHVLARCYERLRGGGVMVIKDNTKSPYWKYVYAYAEDIIKTKLGVYGRDVKEHSSRYWGSQEFLKLLDKIGFRATMIPLKSRLPYPGVFYVCHKPAHPES